MVFSVNLSIKVWSEKKEEKNVFFLFIFLSFSC